MPGNRFANRAPSLRASRKTGPVRRSRKIARATTSRGASSASAMPVAHEAHAARVHEHRALAAHRLGDQRERILRRVERRRMELHELHVGERDAGAMRDRVAVARRDHRIRRVPIDLAAAARREHRRVGDDLRRAPFDARAHADARAAPHDELEHARASRARGCCFVSRTRATSVRATSAPVWSPCAWTMRFFECAASRPSLSRPRGSRSKCAPAVCSSRTRAGPSSTSTCDRRRVAQRGARGERVLTVQRRRIAGAERRGDAALRVGGRAVEQRSLRQQHDVAVLGRTPRRVQPGDAAADDEKARADAFGHEA